MYTAKQNHYHQKIEENTDNPRKLWSIMHDLAPAALKSKESWNIKITADLFAEYFSKIGGQTAEDKDLSESDVDLNHTGFEIVSCSEEEILSIIKNIPTNKANGIDGISIKSIKLGLKALITPITRLVIRNLQKHPQRR